MSSVDGLPCEIRIWREFGSRQGMSHSTCCAVGVVVASGVAARAARIVLVAVRVREVGGAIQELVARVVREAAAPPTKPIDSK